MVIKGWMGLIPDCWRLSALSLPGTHNSLTYDKSSFCTSIFGQRCCRCQNTYVKDQLLAGIRVFDIRPALWGSAIILWHGPINLNVRLWYVLDVFINFLRDHDDEAIILLFNCYWEDSDDGFCGKEFVDEFLRVLSYVGNGMIYPAQGQNIDYVPTIGEVRGKIVLFNRDGRSTQDRIPSLNVNSKYQDTWTFDYSYDEYYNQLLSNIKSTKDEIYNQGGARCANPKTLHFTWLNANNCALPGNGPGYISSYVNPWIANQLRCLMRTHPNPEQRFERWQPSGIIMMDYPDHEIIAQIVIDNFFHYDSVINHHKNADCKSTI